MTDVKRNTLFRFIPPGILIFSLLWIYLATIAPGLTWANSGSDGGDLITAAATGGIAHPSGYPVYLLLARGFQSLPVGSLAFRTNLMSAFFAVGTSLLVYVLVLQCVCNGISKNAAFIASLSAGFSVGLAPLVWSQAVITEVYTLHAFFVALILYLATQSANLQHSRRVRLDCMRGIVYGLAMGNHLTIIALIPFALFASCVSWSSSPQEPTGFWRSIKVDWKSAGRQLAWMLFGLSVYVILPLRAMTRPVMNWGNPVNLPNFWWLVSGNIYQFYYFPNNLIQIWARLQSGANLFLQQFGLLGILLGFTGLILFFKISRLYVLTIWTGLIFAVIALGYQSPDSFVYFIPAVISFSIWIGIGTGYIAQYLTKWQLLWNWLFAVALLLNLSFRVVAHWDSVDASHDERAENFGKQVISSLPEDAIVFVKGDQAVFASWYFHFALQQRSDISVIAMDLLHWNWYLDSLKQTYPLMNFSTMFPWPSTIATENPTRPVCQVAYADSLEVKCESN